MSTEVSNLLIQAVQKHDVLYNRQNPKYKDNFHRQSVWQLIASEIDCFADGKAANAKWKQIRQAYTRSRRRSCNAAKAASANGIENGEDCSSSDDVINERWSNMRWLDPFLDMEEDDANGGLGSNDMFNNGFDDSSDFLKFNGTSKFEFPFKTENNNDSHIYTSIASSASPFMYESSVGGPTTTTSAGAAATNSVTNGCVSGGAKKRKLNISSPYSANSATNTNGNGVTELDYDEQMQKQLLDVMASLASVSNGYGFGSNNGSGCGNVGVGYGSNGNCIQNSTTNGGGTAGSDATSSGGCGAPAIGEDDAYGRYIGEKMKRLTAQQRAQARMRIEAFFYELEYGNSGVANGSGCNGTAD